MKTKKLSLKKEAVRNLSTEEMAGAAGGAGGGYVILTYTCRCPVFQPLPNPTIVYGPIVVIGG